MIRLETVTQRYSDFSVDKTRTHNNVVILSYNIITQTARKVDRVRGGLECLLNVFASLNAADNDAYATSSVCYFYNVSIVFLIARSDAHARARARGPNRSSVSSIVRRSDAVVRPRTTLTIARSRTREESRRPSRRHGFRSRP